MGANTSSKPAKNEPAIHENGDLISEHPEGACKDQLPVLMDGWTALALENEQLRNQVSFLEAERMGLGEQQFFGGFEQRRELEQNLNELRDENEGLRQMLQEVRNERHNYTTDKENRLEKEVQTLKRELNLTRGTINSQENKIKALERTVKDAEVVKQRELFAPKKRLDLVTKELEENKKSCVCAKQVAQLLMETRAAMHSTEATHTSDMEHKHLALATDLIRHCIADDANSSFGLLAAHVARRLEESLGGRWVCFVGSLKRLSNGSFRWRPGTKLEYSVGRLHFTVFAPLV